MRTTIRVPYYRDELDPDRVKYFTASKKRVTAHLRNVARELTRGESLDQLEREFPWFVRLSRHYLVHSGAILRTRVRPGDNGWTRHYAVLEDQEVLISRRRVKEVLARVRG